MPGIVTLYLTNKAALTVLWKKAKAEILTLNGKFVLTRYF